MSKQQKRCFIFSAVGHGVLLLLVLYGPESSDADMTPQDRMPPVELVRPEALESGRAGRQSPPQKPTEPSREKTPSREPEPEPEPKPQEKSLPEPQKEAPSKETESPEPRPSPKPEPVKPNLNQARRQSSPSPATPKPNLERTSRSQRSPSEIDRTIETLEEQLSGSAEIDLGGTSGRAGANYARYVKDRYERAWIPPSQVHEGGASVAIEVTILSDGRVEAARITSISGVGALDQSVRRALERVKRVKPFPSGVEASRKTYRIVFNLQKEAL